MQSPTMGSQELEHSPKFWMQLNSKDISVLDNFKRLTEIGDHSYNNSEFDHTNKNHSLSTLNNSSELKTDLVISKPESSRYSDTAHVSSALQRQRDKRKQKYLMISGDSGQLTLIGVCSKCKILNFEHNNHCDSCQKCVRFWDHHSPFLDTCIGANNLHYYFAFLWFCAFTFICNLFKTIIFLFEWIRISDYLLSQRVNSTLLDDTLQSDNYQTRRTKDFQKNMSFSSYNLVEKNPTLAFSVAIFNVALVSLYACYFLYFAILYSDLMGRNLPYNIHFRRDWKKSKFSWKVLLLKSLGRFSYSSPGKKC